MDLLAAATPYGPFDPGSLTEDYEIGLKLADHGQQGVFIRMRDRHGELVCTQERFPERLDAAVRQKARWMAGIAFAGWDRMGWSGKLRECWVRLHDRKGGLAALVLLAAYLALVLYGCSFALELTGHPVRSELPDQFRGIMSATALLMLWRMGIRALFTGRCYGWHQGLLAIPRMLVANYIAILAARRALALYLSQWRSGTVTWEKTQHFAHQ
jgi:adsorption protein B